MSVISNNMASVDDVSVTTLHANESGRDGRNEEPREPRSKVYTIPTGRLKFMRSKRRSFLSLM